MFGALGISCLLVISILIGPSLQGIFARSSRTPIQWS
jgi:hypothetical protein